MNELTICCTGGYGSSGDSYSQQGYAGGGGSAGGGGGQGGGYARR